MSLLQLLSDVIEEVCISERSLEPGDIPDRTIFKHVRSLWHLLLGIEENKYDAHNYELMELSFNSNEYAFACFTYLGSDFENIAETVPHSIGFPQESLKVVELLDDKINEDETEDDSVSVKLSMLNQIRFLLFNHHIMVDKLIIDDHVERVIAEYLTTDIKSDNGDNASCFSSNNHIFDICYNRCYEKFVLGDSELSIEEISREILETFKYEAGVAFFFNHKILTDFHAKMVDVLKRVYRKHDFVDVEIDDYFKHNPILPILIPIYRKLALQTYEDDKPQEVNEKERIGIALLKQILIDLSTNKLENVLGDVPVSLKRFPLVVNYYIESLGLSGTKLIENDPFIQLIESCILKWVNKEIDTEVFVTQLCELSTVPTAEPYTYKNIQFPNVHMRMAVFKVRQSIRIYETYFMRWKNKIIRNKGLLKIENQVISMITEKYYAIWKYKYQKVKIISSVNLYVVETPVMKLFFQKWKRKQEVVRRDSAIADRFFIKKYYHVMEVLTMKSNCLEKQAESFYRALLLKRVFKLWVSNRERRYPEATEKFGMVRKRTIFTFLKVCFAKHQQKFISANLFYKNTLKHQFYNKWKSKAKGPLVLLSELDQKAEKFIVRQKFIRWKLLIDLHRKEIKFKAHNDQEVLRKMFSMWLRLKHLSDLEVNLINKLQSTLCEQYLGIWKRVFNLLLRAELHYRSKRISLAFNKWKLEAKHSIFQKQMIKKKQKNYFHIWALKATAQQYLASRNYIILSETFVYWSEKTDYLMQESRNNLIQSEINHTSTYFQFWKKLFKKLKDLNCIGEAFLKQKLQNDQLLLKKRFMEKLRIKSREFRLKRLELNRAMKSFNHFRERSFISQWKRKYSKVKETEDHASFYQRILYETHYYDRWLVQYDRILQLNSILLSKLDSDNLDLLNKILSKLQIRMVKIHTDENKSTRFKKRWNKIRLKTFFELWKLKKVNRTSPTPTARTNYNMNDHPDNVIPDLNPYIDLAPRDRGSPEYKGPFRPQFTSILNGQATQFEISASMGDSQTPLVSRTEMSSFSYKTPMMRRMASKSNSHMNSRISPDKTGTNITESVKRARQRLVEERLSMYRLLRPPPSTHKQKLSVVSESSTNIFDGGSIFDTPNDSLISSTPIKNSQNQ